MATILNSLFPTTPDLLTPNLLAPNLLAKLLTPILPTAAKDRTEGSRDGRKCGYRISTSLRLGGRIGDRRPRHRHRG